MMFMGVDMEIKIGDEFVIYSSRNGSSIVLGKIPEGLKGSLEPIDPIRISNKRYYSTIFGAIDALFKQGVIDSDARNFLELEGEIKRISQLCDYAFSLKSKGSKAT